MEGACTFYTRSEPPVGLNLFQRVCFCIWLCFLLLDFFFKIVFYVYEYFTCMFVSIPLFFFFDLYHFCAWCPQSIEFPETRVTDSCDPHVDGENQTGVLWNNRKCS